MSHKRLWIASVIIALVILTGFVLSVPHTRDVGKTAVSNTVVASVPAVALRDSFKKGVHTITGTVEAPNACTAIAAQAALTGVASSSTEIAVALSMPPDAGVCLQVPSLVPFSVTVNAPAHLPILVTVNGAPATTTAL